jgi:uncharacterized protein YidB (DUF937 family)
LALALRKFAPESLEAVVGVDTLDMLGEQTGMKRDDLLAGLSRHLPTLIDHLKQDGRVPTAEEASRKV